MLRIWRTIVLLMVAIGLIGRAVQGAVQVELPEGSGTFGGWQLMAVRFAPVAGEVEVRVQDVRGGLAVVRQVEGSSGRAWMSLPLVAPAELAGKGGGIWRVEVVVSRAGGEELERGQSDVPLDGSRSLRMATAGPGGAYVQSVAVPFTEEEILTAPALVFAGVDLVMLTPTLAERMSQSRAEALLAVGVRLLTPGERPVKGELSALVWERAGILGDVPVWGAPGIAVEKPAVVEPGLWRYLEGHARDDSSHGLRVILWTGPIGIGVLLLARGLFHRRGVVLLAAGVGMLLLTAGMVLYLRGTEVERRDLATWEQTAGMLDQGVGGVRLTEQMVRLDAGFAASMREAAEGGEVVLPVAGTLREYWAFRRLTLALNGPQMELRGTMAARSRLYLERRRAEVTGLVPALGGNAAEEGRLLEALKLTPGAAWWLDGGYVRLAGRTDVPEVLWHKWAGGRPWGAVSDPDVWYDMRYEGGHRYLVYERNGHVGLVDFPPRVMP